MSARLVLPLLTLTLAACDTSSSPANGPLVGTCEGGDRPSEWYPDADGDGYGDSGGVVLGCLAPEGAIRRPGDCDDSDAAVNPEATERCNDVDDDCDPFNDLEVGGLSVDGQPVESLAEALSAEEGDVVVQVCGGEHLLDAEASSRIDSLTIVGSHPTERSRLVGFGVEGQDASLVLGARSDLILRDVDVSVQGVRNLVDIPDEREGDLVLDGVELDAELTYWRTRGDVRIEDTTVRFGMLSAHGDAVDVQSLVSEGATALGGPAITAAQVQVATPTGRLEVRSVPDARFVLSDVTVSEPAVLEIEGSGTVERGLVDGGQLVVSTEDITLSDVVVRGRPDTERNPVEVRTARWDTGGVLRGLVLQGRGGPGVMMQGVAGGDELVLEDALISDAEPGIRGPGRDSLRVRGGTIRDCTALGGAAIWTGGSLVIEGTTLLRNEALSEFGAAVSVTGTLLATDVFLGAGDNANTPIDFRTYSDSFDGEGRVSVDCTTAECVVVE